jgi:hypothetical protein
MVNSLYIANLPWKQQDQKSNNANELEAGWETREPRCCDVLEWRMLLIPYLRAADGNVTSMKPSGIAILSHVV